MDPLLPDLSGRPHRLETERRMRASASALFRAWTREFDRWFAAEGTLAMVPEVGRPYFFETRFEDQRHPHYGRFLELAPDRRVQLSWITESGTRGAETVLTVDLEPDGDGTLLRLVHEGFPDEALRDGHAAAWPGILEMLDGVLAGEGDR